MPHIRVAMVRKGVHLGSSCRTYYIKQDKRADDGGPECPYCDTEQDMRTGWVHMGEAKGIKERPS